jgi:hypothetical protein
MRIKFISLVALLLAFGSVGLAQSDGSQQLRHYDPQTQSIEQNLGQEKLTIDVDKAISTSTRQSLISYLLQHYTSNLLSFEIDNLPGTDNLYAVTGRFSEAQNSSAEALLLLLREQGGKVSEVNKLKDENAEAYGVIRPVFFSGQNRLLIIVSMSSADGDARMDLVYEYAGNNFKPLGEIEVIEKLGESGGVWRIDSPVKRATAEYKNGNYYLTLRGRGSLHLGWKKIAPPRSPVTFFYNGKEWRLQRKGVATGRR